MNDFLKLMQGRRSIRKYTDQPLTDAQLEQILYAASFSPNAGNRQTTQIVVCRNREINEKLGRINRAAFHGRVSDGIHFVSQAQPSIADDASIKSAFYGAPTVVTLFGPRGFLYAEADCWIMAGSIALAAYALGVGSCVLGRAEETFSSPYGQELLQKWQVPEHLEAQVHITLGFPKDGFPPEKPRTYPAPIAIDEARA